MTATVSAPITGRHRARGADDPITVDTLVARANSRPPVPAARPAASIDDVVLAGFRDGHTVPIRPTTPRPTR